MNWEPFSVCGRDRRSDPPRAIDTREGVGDRLRAAAFAELQAREAFLWAADTLEDAPSDLRGAWRNLAHAEDKHLGWLLKRMTELGIDVRERQVSDQLWATLRSCKTAREFALFMASAEDRGRKAGERFGQVMAKSDPVSAEIFAKIAEEEVTHIELARRFYPEAPATDPLP